MKKFIIALSASVLLISPVVVSADTVTIGQLLAQIASLQAQIAALQAGMGDITTAQKSAPSNAAEKVYSQCFERDLFAGLGRDSDVKRLQKFLTDQGYFDGPITGNYGPITRLAIQDFQTDNGIEATGRFGAITRAAANKLIGCDSSVSLISPSLPSSAAFKLLPIPSNILTKGTVILYRFSAMAEFQKDQSLSSLHFEITNHKVAGLELYQYSDSSFSFRENSFVVAPFGESGLLSPTNPPYLPGGSTRYFELRGVISDVSPDDYIKTSLIGFVPQVLSAPGSDDVSGGGKLYIEPSSASMAVGESKSFQAFYQPPMPRCDTAGIACPQVMPARFPVVAEWTSSNPSVASIIGIAITDTTGQPFNSAEVKGISNGAADIKASYKSFAATARITVGSVSSVPSITVISPNGGEVWQTGTTQVIRWLSTGNIPIVDITTTNVPSVYIASSILNSGSFSWTIPADFPPGQYKLRVTPPTGDATRPNDTSDAPFSIVAAGQPQSLTLTVPNGGEVWQLETIHTILWTPYAPDYGSTPPVNPTSQVSAYLERYENGGFTRVGKIIESGKASIHWVGELDSYGNYPKPGDYYVRIENRNTGASDRSDKPFKLVPRNAIVADLKVNGADGPITVPSGGATYNVSWTSNAQNCTIYNDTLSYGSVGYMMSNLPPSGSQLIKLVVNTITSLSLVCESKVTIEGSAWDNVQLLPSVSTESNINILSPNGGESIGLSDQQTISWSSSKDINKVSIALYKNDAFLNWIVTNYPLDESIGGGYTWIPSQTISSSNIGGNVFKIYIIGYKSSGGTVEDKSNAPFSILAATAVVPTLNVSLDASTPTSVTLKPGQTSVKFAQIKATAGSSPVNNLNGIQIGSDSSNASAFLTNFRVFDGATQIGGSLSELSWGGSYYQNWLFLSGVSIPANTSKVFTVVADVKPTAPSGSVRLGIAGWNFDAPGASVVPFGTAIYGNSMTIVAATAQLSITVLSPNGGETWNLGDTKSVTWSASNVTSSHQFFVEIDKGQVYAGGFILPHTDRSVSFYVDPRNTGWLAGGSDFKARVTVQEKATGMSLATDLSNAPFSIGTIVAPTPTTVSISRSSLSLDSFKYAGTVTADLLRFTVNSSGSVPLGKLSVMLYNGVYLSNVRLVMAASGATVSSYSGPLSSVFHNYGSFDFGWLSQNGSMDYIVRADILPTMFNASCSSCVQNVWVNITGLAASESISGTSVTVTGLPVNGNTVYFKYSMADAGGARPNLAVNHLKLASILFALDDRLTAVKEYLLSFSPFGR